MAPLRCSGRWGGASMEAQTDQLRTVTHEQNELVQDAIHFWAF